VRHADEVRHDPLVDGAGLVRALRLLSRSAFRSEPVFDHGPPRLNGYLVDANGQFAGTRVSGDADGVPVELLHGSEIVRRTRTVDGIYRFSGLPPGGYVARSRAIGDIYDETNPMTIAISDVECADTLRLASRGDLYSYPNPFATGDTMRISFDVPDTMRSPSASAIWTATPCARCSTSGSFGAALRILELQGCEGRPGDGLALLG
jgi:hypothetical protein